MKRQIIYYAWNLLLGSVIYLTVFGEAEGWGKILYFYLWVSTICNLTLGLCKDDPDIRETIRKLREKGLPVPFKIETSLTILFIGFLIFHSFWLAGILLFCEFIFTCCLYQKSEEAKSDKLQKEKEQQDEILNDPFYNPAKEILDSYKQKTTKN